MLEGQTCSLGGSPALLMKLACADYRKGWILRNSADLKCDILRS